VEYKVNLSLQCHSVPAHIYDFPAFFCNSSDNNSTCAGFTVELPKDAHTDHVEGEGVW